MCAEVKNILDNVTYPVDIKKFTIQELKQLANELRKETISVVSKSGGHLGAGLGVVELTVALHFVFDTPEDKLVWDVGHQTYPHKILTGRKNQMDQLRKAGGLAGFTKITESPFDAFGAGHSSTSISAAFGIMMGEAAMNHDKTSLKKNQHIAIIGDGAISAGMAYEALNNAGAERKKLIVILNDNAMSISKPVGAVSNYLAMMITSKQYLNFRKFSRIWLGKIPKTIADYIKKLAKAVKSWWIGGNIFEEMGFYYIGPIDGHDLDLLVPILQNIKNDDGDKPIFLHIVTKKGMGCDFVESQNQLHSVSPFNIKTGKQNGKKSEFVSYSDVFANTLISEAKNDSKIVAITAAMLEGTGLEKFNATLPDRCFDVAIAEQHAVTFAAGMAISGAKPVVAIYSTFLQRAFDQIVHDVAIQKLPVRFAIDRAGLVGQDGPTHAGSFDVAYLSILPNFVVMAAADGLELVKMIKTSLTIDDKPSSVRYPRGNSSDITADFDYDSVKPLEIGKGRIIKTASKTNQKKSVAIISFGAILQDVIEATKILEEQYLIDISIADARFAKPLDHELISKIAENNDVILSAEEGSIGGFGAILGKFLLENKFLDNGKLTFRTLEMKDEFINHNHVISDMKEEAGIGVNSIVKKILEIY